MLAARQEAFQRWNWPVEFWPIVRQGSANLKQPTTTFVAAWLTLALTGPQNISDNREARQLIHNRERWLKRSRARLDNPRALELWSGAAGIGRLNYRWGIAQTLLTDILQAKGKMLNPHARQDLFAVLRPPDGYLLDQAIGTTFSLDLLTLLTVPLAFTFFSGADGDGDIMRDPLALLDGVRRYAGRILIFCQAGQIAVPKQGQQLFSYLENRIFEVAPLVHEQAVFHPKVWLLRYRPAAEAAARQPLRYRFICLSRNLTFDRSWDTSLTLDGALTDRKNAYSRNHPLADFFDSLPDLLIRPRKLPAAAAAVIDQLQQEVRRVDFQLPRDFDDLAFIPLGLNGRKKWPFPNRARKQLVVSPFITPGFLGKFAAGGRSNILVSRVDGLSSLTAAQLQAYPQIYVMNDEADPEEEDQDGNEDTLPDSAQTTTPAEAPPDTLLSGLHAKLFICEEGREAVIWSGSANATSAAFYRNVEFLVQLSGQKSRVGINKFLTSSQDGQVGFLDLLVRFNPQADPQETDPRLEKLQAEAMAVQRRLARLPLRAEVTVPDHARKGENFNVHIFQETEQRIAIPEHITLRCWPITLQAPAALAADVTQSCLAAFASLSMMALTPFFAFEVTATAGNLQGSVRFVLAIPLHNAPQERHEQIMRALLNDKSKILRYLFFLLAGEGAGFSLLIDTLTGRGRSPGTGSILPFSGTLFEALTRALDQQPEKLDHVANLVADLEKAGQQSLLPSGFYEIWPPIWQARQQLGSRQETRQGHNGN